MAECNITSVQVLNNPAPFTEPFCLEVQYECLSALQEDLEWKLIYMGSAESPDYDQQLDSALVGPVQKGHFKFRMEAPAPDPSRIPADSLLGLTGLLLTCSYRGKEFVRVGYYVNVEYTDPELADETKPRPNPPLLDKLQRSVMADHPRVTKFPNDFDNEPAPIPLEAEPLDDEIMPEDGPDDYDDEDEDDEDGDDEDLEALEEPAEEQAGGSMAAAAAPDAENVDPNGARTSLGGKPGGMAAAATAAAAGVAEEMEM